MPAAFNVYLHELWPPVSYKYFQFFAENKLQNTLILFFKIL